MYMNKKELEREYGFAPGVYPYFRPQPLPLTSTRGEEAMTLALAVLSIIAFGALIILI